MGTPMSGHLDITPDLIRAAAKQTGTSEMEVRKALLGLIPDEHGVVAALVSMGVDATFLRQLHGVPRATSGEVAA